MNLRKSHWMSLSPTIGLAFFLVLTACNFGGTDDPYAELRDGLWITFLENPEASKGTCNPIVETAYRGDNPPQTIELVMRASFYKPTLGTINKTLWPRLKIKFQQSSSPDLLIGRTTMFEGKPFAGTCKEMSLHLIRRRCASANSNSDNDCPYSGRTRGLQWFGFVRESS